MTESITTPSIETGLPVHTSSTSILHCTHWKCTHLPRLHFTLCKRWMCSVHAHLIYSSSYTPLPLTYISIHKPSCLLFHMKAFFIQRSTALFDCLNCTYIRNQDFDTMKKVETCERVILNSNQSFLAFSILADIALKSV